MDAYVYGVTRAGATERSPGEGIDGQLVEVATHDGLAALVSDAPNVPVKANRRNLMAHSTVLQELVGERCVLPMRFGVVMPDRGAVATELLDAHREELTEELESFAPYVELDVRAICPEDELLASIVAERRDIAELRGATEYSDRIRLGELIAQAVAERKEDVTRRLVAELEPLAAASALNDPLHDQMLANAAFLVERTAVDDFDRAVERVGAAVGDVVRIRYAGPLPPHNFVDLASGTEAPAWG
jgi:Gas vesicle synthesis protein GvpL/GvpF